MKQATLFSTTLKHSILFVLALMAFWSCKEEGTLTAGGEGTGALHTVTASIVTGGTATRTSMGTLADDVYPVNWSAGDRFAVIASGKYPYALVSDPGSTEGRFEGMDVDKYTGTNVYPAAYPYASAFARMDTEDTDVILVGSVCPQVQTYVPNNFATNAYPMAAASTNGLSYGFRNLCGVLQIPIRGIENADGVTNLIRSLTLEGNKRERIAGEVAMAFDAATGTPVASAEDKDYGCKVVQTGEKERIIIDFGEDGLHVSTTDLVYVNIILPPTLFEDGFTITLMDYVHGGSDVHKSVENVMVKRSYLTQMSEVTYNTAEPMVPANCYIMSEPGYDMHPAYCMGNRLSVPIPTEGRTVNCALLWIDTDPAAISDVEYLPFADGRGMFSYRLNTDPSTGEAYRGNAVIALYDEDTKDILWTWHIWMTEEPETVLTGGYCAEGTYEYTFPGFDIKYNYHAEAVAAGDGLEIMDRNLGAISANPADGWKTYGLYYQDGRRDPFVGAWGENGSSTTRDHLYSKGSTSGITETEQNFSTWQLWEDDAFSYTDSSWGTLAYDKGSHTWWNTELTDGWKVSDGNHYMTITESIRNPMTYSGGQDGILDPQWTNYNDADCVSYMDPFLNSDGTPIKNPPTDEASLKKRTGLSSGGHEAYWNRTKTIMDPCPAGWSLIGKAMLVGKNDTKAAIKDEANGIFGITTTFNSYTIWWPAAGTRDTQGRICDVGYRGSYWYFDHIAAEHGGHGWSFTMAEGNKGAQYTEVTSVEGNVMTNQASSLRCVREKQTNKSTGGQ